MRSKLVTLSVAAVLAACTPEPTMTGDGSVNVRVPDHTVPRPKARPGAGDETKNTGGGYADARKADDVQKPATPNGSGKAGRNLGVTIATLGLLERSGLWLSTPLVTREAPGQVTYVPTGESVAVTLVPSGAASGSGSQLSLAAMQALGIPLTELAEIRVIAK